MPTKNSANPTAIELFAGVGGFRLALEKQGWLVNWSNQWEPSTKSQHASSCYIKNFGDENHFNEDINVIVEKILSKELTRPKADLIVGGFPCQDYSVAKALRSSRGLKGKKGVLWWPLLSFIEIVKPKYVLLENVDRLLKSPVNQPGRDFAIILKTLSDLGYFVEWRVINSADYGFPQRRKRTFILASMKKFKITNSIEFITRKSILSKALKCKEITEISGFELLDEPWQISKYFSKNGKRSPFKSAGYFDGQKVYTVDVESISLDKKFTLRNILLPDSKVDEEFWIPKNQIAAWRYQKGSKTIPRTSKSGHKYLYAEGSMSFPDDVNKPSRTILTAEGGASPSRFRHVIKTLKGFRRLTPIELERLNGFPDNWTKFGDQGEEFSSNRRSFFMGNALVVGIVEKIAKELFDSTRIH